MNEKLYIESASSLLEKVNRIDAIIEAMLLNTTDNAVGNSDLEYYTLDDGQTKITTAYRDIRLIPQAIDRFITLRNYYSNMLNGRSRILRDFKGCQ
jgi:hypothetical protein